MKSNLITLIALSLLITCNLQDTKAQTASINGNQYAFTYSGTADPPTAPTGFGLYFNQNNPAPARYEFKDNIGTTVWSTEANTGKTWSAGSLYTDGDVIADGNLRPGGALWVGADKYAFQYYNGSSATQFGLFFSLTNTAYEFMSGTGTAIFSVGASSGDGVFSGGVQVGNSSSLVEGNIRWRTGDLEVFTSTGWQSLISGGGSGGVTGPTGPTGAQGLQGLFGPQGPTGPSGAQGAQGATGSQGATGTDGQGGVTTAGADIAIAGSGTVADPYVVSSKTYTIGLWPELGGYVFWVSSDGKHGLVAETQDQTNATVWYNAQDIISNPSNHSVDGQKFRDWRMPTKFELNEMYLQRAAIGGFANLYYWSSTEGVNNFAWGQSFTNGGQSLANEDFTNSVRAVRAF